MLANKPNALSRRLLLSTMARSLAAASVTSGLLLGNNPANADSYATVDIQCPVKSTIIISFKEVAVSAFGAESAGSVSCFGLTSPVSGAIKILNFDINNLSLQYTPNDQFIGIDEMNFYCFVAGENKSIILRINVANDASLPQGFAWTLVGSHPTGWVTDGLIQSNWNTVWPEAETKYPSSPDKYIWRRLSIANASDGIIALKHTVTNGQLVWPLGFAACDFARKNSLDKAYLMRYRHWVVDYPGSPGKWIEFEGGRGWGGNKYRYSSGAIKDGVDLGSDGWGSNVMHPPRNSTLKLNGIGSLASNGTLASGSSYGTSFNSASSWVVPQGRWFTVDMLVVAPSSPTGHDGAYRLFVDNTEIVKLLNIRPAQSSMANVRSLRVVLRLMDGGDPDDPADRSVRPYSEYFSNFEIWRGN